ncbi:hypothetical protein E2562_031563 [Oryza meyeriana var. granulata]|uniref:Uncharacterized protein n=1 Tax=Oryza meyeriana var. granulata TaxID=110450 RepID=A0A6G1CUB4_9ORYZ|nr:hypothetical protein E2562_031563 [Oryza meyeriana var. granulata]
MTLEGLEQLDLTHWLMDKINPKTMCIEISPTKTIKITPLKISIVMGTPFGGDELWLPNG